MYKQEDVMLFKKYIFDVFSNKVLYNEFYGRHARIILGDYNFVTSVFEMNIYGKKITVEKFIKIDVHK